MTNVNLLIQTATHSYIVLNTRTKQIELWLWKTMRNYFCDVNTKVTKANLDDILQTRRNVYHTYKLILDPGRINTGGIYPRYPLRF